MPETGRGTEADRPTEDRRGPATERVSARGEVSWTRVLLSPKTPSLDRGPEGLDGARLVRHGAELTETEWPRSSNHRHENPRRTGEKLLTWPGSRLQLRGTQSPQTRQNRPNRRRILLLLQGMTGKNPHCRPPPPLHHPLLIFINPSSPSSSSPPSSA